MEHGFRSGLEDVNAALLLARGQLVSYEAFKLEYVQPGKLRKYTPDFILENGIIIETKGRFVTADRQKHLMIKECHPGLDIRFVFSRPNDRISTTSKTTYAAWCKHKGFQFAAVRIPEAWMDEAPNKAAIYAAEKALGWKPQER